ncbi:ABC transporter ATP-binding protein [Saccharospirillum salsuginis]|uniref:ABC transporter antibiotic-transport ATP-binding protein n=1 Tax=Saccharospirillum salsuginis TaxID=418750 RepID=A0A918KLY7_9GAMM|nr:ABC transporter ATP-binding protein [Saccharospirillum salsuginis]GGX68282.1 putative ABC transporter antibiotic-transport ATP-binding protein [Saccharospirillum salsuginis]
MIDVEQLRNRYSGRDEDTLKGLSFSVEPGEIFGFLGPSGSGKSTTQRLLIGLEKGHRGAIRLFGRPIQEWNAALYRRIGVCFELPNHYAKLTARENLAVFAALQGIENRRRIDAVLDQVGLLADADTRTARFSKGMKIRLNLARALLPEPDLLFLDEPTSGLDPVTAGRIKSVIQDRQAAGTTVFLTTHTMQDADQLCDRVAFIVDGELKQIDAPSVLKQRFGEDSLTVRHVRAGRVMTSRFPLQELANNADFQALLRTDRIEQMHSQEASLDDVFIRVTGAALI